METSPGAGLTAQELYAQLYDVCVADWPGEMDFYRSLIARSPAAADGVLEIACGSGRVALRLAREGARVTGLDVSPELLTVARQKSAGLPDVDWVLADMRSFDLGRKFGCAIIPGHSFQFMLTADDQMACLGRIKRHLAPGGLLAVHLDHQDVRWLAGLLTRPEPVFEPGPVLPHPTTGRQFRKSTAWAYQPATQTATAMTIWEQMDPRGDVINTWQMPPMPLHCVFPFEMEHLLRRAGFAIEAVCGDFAGAPLGDGSEQMIWIARNEP